MVNGTQDKLRRAERAALQRMADHGYSDPRLLGLKGTVDEFDKCREYDQKLAYFRHVELANLDREVSVNVPRQRHDWVANSYG